MATSASTPTLEALLQALSTLTQDKRIVRQQFARSAPEAAHELVPFQVEGEEHVCGGVRYRLQCLSRGYRLPLKDLQGHPLAIAIGDEKGGQRVVCGIVARVEQLHSDGAATLVQLELRDALSLMRLRRNWRVFQEVSVIDITRRILDEHIQRNPVFAAAFRYTTHLLKTYPPRAFTLQAGESDHDFLSRLWRQEGLAWHFVFTLDESLFPTHRLVLADDAYAYDANPAGTVRFHRADATEDSDTVVAWQAWRKLTPRSIQRRQFEYKAVRANDIIERGRLAQGDAGHDAVATLDDYHYDAARLAANWGHQGQMDRTRILAHEYAGKAFRGESVVRQFAAGTRFTLSEHDEIDSHEARDREFTLTGLHVYARNNIKLGAGLGASLFHGWRYDLSKDKAKGEAEETSDAPIYYNRFECVRSTVPIVPAFDARDLPAVGLLSAIVAGPEGSEIDVDESGRILVRFLFTREEERPAGYADSARIRVMHPWADAGFGAAFWPRVGSEILVGFVQNHPDKPVALGGVYDGTNLPPRFARKGSLPANAPLSGFRSKELGAERHNHVRFSDFAGQLGVQTASDHAATQLNQGWLGTPHDEGRSQPRGEGFELATDAAGALRSAKGLLLSTFARLKAEGAQLDRQETLGVMQECVELFKALGDMAAEHQGLPVDTKPHEKQQTQLKDWENGSNTAPEAGGGGAPLIALASPEGLHHSTPASVVTHAGQNIDSVASKHLQFASGGRTVVNAGQGVSTFAQSGGIRSIAMQGEHLTQSQKGDTVVQSAQDLRLSASGGKVQVLAASEILLSEAGGAYIKLAGGKVEIGCPGSFTVKAASHVWMGPASVSAELPKFSMASLERQPVVVRASDGAPVEGAPYKITKEDGSVIEGKTGADGHTEPFSGERFEHLDALAESPDNAKKDS